MNKENKLFTIGVDLGGTKIDAAVVDSSGNFLSSNYKLIGDDKSPQKVISDIIDSIYKCLEQSGVQVSAIGLAVAGQIDRVEGIVKKSPNLPQWQNTPLRHEIEKVFRVPVTINNDVRTITWAEWKYGAGQGINDLVCLFIGTGIGGGIVSGGKLLEGCTNTAGELGHLTIVAGGRKCSCPNEGCLEAYAGGWAIAERARDAVKANPEAGKTILSIAGSNEKITSVTVSQAYRAGDPLAQRLVKDTAKYLAAGIVSIVNAFNPCLIIIGGGVLQGLPELVEMARSRVMSQALQTPRENLRITLPALGTRAGVIGAAALARELMK
ncbi:MAG: ROK family protein [Dehalococcoidales bacterium]|jgi:glucokinase|nr:ROK family protein [Dehalococcoidales bacterium]